MAFQLDASGPVALPRPHSEGSTQTYWSDLSPFAQGYVEALLRVADVTPGVPHDRHIAFSDLAPETLARIIADCEAAATSVPSGYSGKQRGEQFWHLRADGIYAERFPPLTVQLGDDGKVKFA